MNLEIVANYCKQPDPFQQKVVLEYFDSLKSSPDGWKLCAESVLNGVLKDESAIFFCFQVIEDYIKSRYSNDNEQNRAALCHCILSLFEKCDTVLLGSNYIQNKYAHLVNSVFLLDFPTQKWNNFFTDFLTRCNGQVNCDVFLRILIQINLDIADREIPRTQKEMQRNTLIKDVMRETCLYDLAQFWFNIINTYRETSPSTVCLCLEVIGAYVSWIDINLITNDSIMSNLFTLFTSAHFRCPVTDCFNSILRKGMDPFAKTQIIEKFINIDYIKQTLADLFAANAGANNNSNNNSNSNNAIAVDIEFAAKMSNLANTIGIELIEAYKKLKNKTTATGGNQQTASSNGAVSIITSTTTTQTNVNDLQLMQLISQAIESKFSLLCQFLSYKDLNVCIKIHSFARDYIQWIKNTLMKENVIGDSGGSGSGGSGDTTSTTATTTTTTTTATTVNNNHQSTIDEKTIMLLAIIVEKSKYPQEIINTIVNKNNNNNNPNTATGVLRLEDDFFDDFRRSTKVLFDNLLLLNCSTVVNFVCDKIVAPTLLNWKTHSLTFADIELALYYFYLIGENTGLMMCGNNNNNNNNANATNVAITKQIEQLIQLLITSSISSYPNSISQSFYFDLIFRYEKYFNTHMSYLLSQILVSFLDERGLRNVNLKIRSKVCRLFNKFVKSYVRSSKVSSSTSSTSSSSSTGSQDHHRQQNFVEDILKRLQDFLKLDIAFDSVELLNEVGLEQLANSSYIIKQTDIDFPYTISVADQAQIYETVTFLIITTTHYDAHHKRELLQNMFSAIWECFEKRYQEMVSLTAAITENGFLNMHNKSQLLEKRLVVAFHMCNLITLVVATSKSFSNVITIKFIGVQDLYLRSFELFVKAMTPAVDHESRHLLQFAIRHLLHRLVVCLDEDQCIPLLPNAIQSLFLSSDEITGKSLQDLVPLFQQIVPKYKHSWLFARDIAPFFAQIFSPLVMLYFKLIFTTAIEVDKLALQRSYYSFLHIATVHQLIGNFFDLESQLVEQILNSLAEGAVNFPDNNVQRQCYQILARLIELYANDLAQGSPAKQNRANNQLFIQFCHKSLLLACLWGPSKAPQDYYTTVEAFTTLRQLGALLGDVLTTYLRSQLLPKYFPTMKNSMDELCSLILMADLKQSRKSIKQALEQFKLDAT